MDKENMDRENMENIDRENRDRENKNKNIGFASALIVIMLLLVGGTAVVKSREAMTLRRHINDGYSRAFIELTDSVDNLNNSLAKGSVTNSAPQMSDISNNIYRQATFAQANLGQLPISHVELDNTSKFLSQVGDYTYSLSKKVLTGGEISEDEKKHLSKLSEYASQLSDRLYQLEQQLYSGDLSFEQLKNENRGKVKAASSSSSDIGTSMSKIEKGFEEYPSLIYDGPFSDHINKMEAKQLKGAKEISKKEAEKKIKDFLKGDKLSNLKLISENSGTIKSYSYEAKTKDDNNVFIEVSKTGGFVVNMIKNRDVKTKKIDVNQAKKEALAFLERNGIKSMKENYWEIKNNTVTINFTYVQDDITMYADLIKVKLALDNGEILGFESKGYLMSHEKERKLNELILTPEEARSKINSKVNIESEKLAVIPLEGGREVLCYEFKVKMLDKTFLIYVNATTGIEERILMLLIDENGTLTI